MVKTVPIAPAANDLHPSQPLAIKQVSASELGAYGFPHWHTSACRESPGLRNLPTDGGFVFGGWDRARHRLWPFPRGPAVAVTVRRRDARRL
jgi:hypothetical protein